MITLEYVFRLRSHKEETGNSRLLSQVFRMSNQLLWLLIPDIRFTVVESGSLNLINLKRSDLNTIHINLNKLLIW